MSTSKRLIWPVWVAIALLGYGLDQASKAAAVAYLNPADPVVLLGGLLKLQLVRNPGAAFSLGADYTVALSIFAIVAFIAVAFFVGPKVKSYAYAIPVGLALAGIAGNLTDRLVRPPSPLRGHVVDMFQIPYWAIFNVADICLTVAAVWLVIVSFRKPQ